MKINPIQSITDHISDNKRQYAIVLTALLAGVIIGSFSAVSLESEQYKGLSDYTDIFISSFNLQPINRSQVFCSSLMTNIKTVFFLWMTGFCRWLIPLTLFRTGIKGYTLGFSTAFLVSAYKGQGVLFALLSFLPQTIIFIPALTVYTVFCIKYSLGVRKLQKRNKFDALRTDMYLRNFLCTLGILTIAVLCSVFDAFIIPPVLKPVCSFMKI